MDRGWSGLTLDSSSLDLLNPNRITHNNNHRRFSNPLTMSRIDEDDDQKTKVSTNVSEFRFPVSLSGIRDREDDDFSSGVVGDNDRQVPGEVDFFSDKKSSVCREDDGGLRVKKEEQDDRTDVNVSTTFRQIICIMNLLLQNGLY